MKLSLFFAIFSISSLASALATRQDHHHHHGSNSSTNGSAIAPGDFSFDELWDMNNRFWTAFLSPNNQKEAKAINSTLFSEDVKGKIDATRTFNGRELNTEYAFGLFAQIALNPNAFTLLGVPVSYEITQFAANKNIVACTLNIEFNVLTLGITYPIQIVGWFTYNAKGEVSQYDATFLRGLDWQFAEMTMTGMKKFNLSTLAATENVVQQQLAKSVCDTHQTYCSGSYQQYASEQECLSFLTNGSVPLGEAWQLGMNTVGCRMVHMNMVPARPSVHCPHLGPTGGGYCTNDRPYSQYTLENYFTNQAFIPRGKSASVKGSLTASNSTTNTAAPSSSSITYA